MLYTKDRVSLTLESSRCNIIKAHHVQCYVPRNFSHITLFMCERNLILAVCYQLKQLIFFTRGLSAVHIYDFHIFIFIAVYV